MDYGGYMPNKGTRLKDVLGNKPFNKHVWDKIFQKLMKLSEAIQTHFGEKMSIDNFDYRWCEDRIERYRDEGRLLNKEEMQRANNLWNKYNDKAYNPDIKI